MKIFNTKHDPLLKPNNNLQKSDLWTDGFPENVEETYLS